LTHKTQDYQKMLGRTNLDTSNSNQPNILSKNILTTFRNQYTDYKI